MQQHATTELEPFENQLRATRKNHQEDSTKNNNGTFDANEQLPPNASESELFAYQLRSTRKNSNGGVRLNDEFNSSNSNEIPKTQTSELETLKNKLRASR
jgi:hypothetical protein